MVLLTSKFVRLFIILSLNTILKFKLTNIFFFKKKLVDALLVGTITIHPIMFYFFMLIFFYKSIGKKKPYILVIVNITNFSIIKFMFITLLLGGF